MKKLLVLLVAMLLVLPIVANAAEKECDPTKEQCVVIPTENDPNIPDAEHDDVTGITTKKFPVYLKQPTEKEIKGVVISIKEKSDDIKSITFEAVDPYSVVNDSSKATYSVKDGQTAKSDTTILLGYVIETFDSEGQDCSLRFEQRINNGVQTGAFVSYAAIIAGVVLVGGIYTATRNKKKLYNI